MKKYLGSIFRGMIMALCAVIVLASCQNVLSPQENEGPAMGSGKGLVSLRLGDSAVVRTILPVAPAFTSYKLSFSKGDQTISVAEDKANGLLSGSVQVELDAGVWTATVQGYRSFTIGQTAKEYLAAKGSKDFTVTAGQTNPVTVDISPLAIGEVGAPLGIFSYNITLPVGVSEAKLTLDNREPINLLPADSASAGSEELNAGLYGLVITLKKDGLSAGVSEVVYIYPGLESKAELDLADIEFADLLFLMGTASAEHPEGVSLPYTVTAYSDEAYTNPIPGATAEVGADGGTWFIKVPASLVGQNVYLEALAAGTTDTVYTASAGTVVVTALEEGQTGLVLTVPVTVSAPVLTALNAAIDAANSEKADVETSVNGKDKAPGTKWVTEAVLNTFNAAISVAEAVKTSAITQNAVNSAVTTLNAAKAIFTGARQSAETSKTTLNEAINVANTAKDGVIANANAGKDLTPGTSWVTQDVLTTFTSAISAAQAVKADTAATQSAVDSAVTTLNAAKATFTDAIGTAPTINAVSPTIDVEPQGRNYAKGATASDLTVEASASQTEALEPGELSYQWYWATSASAEGTLISDETSDSYTPLTDAAGKVYYYVVVTNTNSSANGATSASTPSARALITVTYSGVSVELDGMPEDAGITLNEPEDALSWEENTEFTFTVDETFSTYAWEVDGQPVAGSTASLVLQAQDYSAGPHTVTAKVSIDGNTWSKQVNFTIER
jgi:hypothetical protein